MRLCRDQAPDINSERGERCAVPMAPERDPPGCPIAYLCQLDPELPYPSPILGHRAQVPKKGSNDTTGHTVEVE